MFKGDQVSMRKMANVFNMVLGLGVEERLRGCMSLVVMILMTGMVVNAQKPVPNEFLPPMQIPPVVSGTFGELRPNHFHSGLDLATNGTVGHKVVAVADGTVSRIKVSATGYGKAVYIRHNNGYTTVYGHLEDYSPKIDSFVLAQQYLKESFEIDWIGEDPSMKVTAGEVIGFSGNSGSSGGPHLHFEIRDSRTEFPINPLLFYRAPLDDVKPIIRGIQLIPLDQTSRVRGVEKPVFLKTVLHNGVYRLEGEPIPIPSAAGVIGAGIDVIDHLTANHRICGVYSIRLLVNGREIYFSEMNQFGFHETRYINSHVDYQTYILTGRKIQKSAVDVNNKLSIYKNLENRGRITIEEGKSYLFRYEVKDTYGNESVAEFTVKGVSLPVVKNEKTDSSTIVKVGRSFQEKNEHYEVFIPENTFYTDVPFSIKPISLPAGAVSKAFSVGNRTTPLHTAISFQLKVPQEVDHYKQKIVMAKIGTNGKPSYAGGQYKFGWVIAKVRELGDYTLMIDSVAPGVSLRNPAPNMNYRGRKTLELTITDNFSGIASYRCEINGIWELFEYDAKTNRLICPLHKLKIVTNKKHSLKVTVTDNAGNSTVRNYNIFY